MVEANPAAVQQPTNPAQQSEVAGIERRATLRKKDTGVFWDEALEIYKNGTININLYNNVLGFTSGDTISGTVDIEIGQVFDAKDLVIELCGVERRHSNHSCRFIIVKMDFQVYYPISIDQDIFLILCHISKNVQLVAP